MHQDELAAMQDATGHSGPYTIGARLDENDGAHTYLARDAAGAPVVVKLFCGERTGNRFINESTYQFDHPNIARILGVGRDRGHGYVVREFVDGVDLGKLAAAPPGREKTAVICDAMRQLAEICVFLKGQRALNVGYDGIEHRQIMAKNVLLGVDGRVRLINFDRARTVVSQERAKTQTFFLPLLGFKRPSSAPILLSDQQSLFKLLYQLFSGHAAAEGGAHLLSGPFGVPAGLREALHTRTASPDALRRIIVKTVEEEGLEIQPAQVGALVTSLDGYHFAK